MMRKEQIEEMAKTMVDSDNKEVTDALSLFFTRLAEALYNAVYRKQSKGEWKDCFNGEYANPTYVCSMCGKRVLLKPNITELGNMEVVQALSPFCPNCGAKMKGGAE